MEHEIQKRVRIRVQFVDADLHQSGTLRREFAKNQGAARDREIRESLSGKGLLGGDHFRGFPDNFEQIGRVLARWDRQIFNRSLRSLHSFCKDF